MKKPVVYLDTSVIGGCFDQQFALWSNGLIEDIRSHHYAFATSEIVALEISRAPAEVQLKYGELLEFCEPLLCTPNEEVVDLVDAYLGHGILSEKFRNDMMHIALAAVFAVDIVASWNFKHIVRYEKIVRFNAVNLEYGYRQLAIHSPREVSSYGSN
jgi:hypothetical protein